MMNVVILGSIALLGTFLLLGMVFEQLSEERDFRRFAPPGRLVFAGAGRLHLFSQGEGPGPTVVIEQGAGSPSIFWWPIQRALARSARVCTYDRAGYLWSPSFGKARSITARVDDLRALLVNSGMPGPFVMVGHSFGGLLISQLARRNPGLIAGLVFVDSPDEKVIYGGRYLAQSKQMLRIVNVMRFVARFGVFRLFNPMLAELPANFGASDVAPLRALAARPGFLAAMIDDFRSMQHASADERQSPAAGSLGAVPVSVVSHGIPFPAPYDALNEGWSEGQARLAELSSNSEIVIAAKSSHMVQFDEPDVVIDAIRRVCAAARDATPLAAR